MDLGSTKEKAGPPWPYFSDSLARGLAVLRSFSGDKPRLTTSEIARITGLSRAATRRFLMTLRDLGYVGSDDDAFFLRPRVLDLGVGYLGSLRVGTLIQPLLVELAAQTKEAATFAVADGLDVLIVGRATNRVVDLSIGSGTRLPVQSTALGHVLLSGVAEERLTAILDALGLDAAGIASLRDQVSAVCRYGYAVYEHDVAPNLRGIAVPIVNDKHETVAALNVTSFRASRSELVENFLPVLMESRKEVENALRLSASWLPLMPSDQGFNTKMKSLAPANILQGMAF